MQTVHTRALSAWASSEGEAPGGARSIPGAVGRGAGQGLGATAAPPLLLGFTCVCVHVHVCTCVCACVYMCVHVRVHVRVYMCVHAHTLAGHTSVPAERGACGSHMHMASPHCKFSASSGLWRN